MAEKLNYIKQYKDLYQPGAKPAAIEVPPMGFFYVDGTGEPGGEAYTAALSALYALTFTVKMSKMGGETPVGYVDYVVPPLEGLWYDRLDTPRQSWRWTSMIRQPEFVDGAVLAWALERAERKKPKTDFSGVRFGVWHEGLCVQAMHTGPFATEQQTLDGMQAFVRENGCEEDFTDTPAGLARRHHEIYLGDPRRTAPEKRRTVLRHPIKVR